MPPRCLSLGAFLLIMSKQQELRAIICYRRSSANQKGRVGDFVASEFGELIYKGRTYGADDVDQFNKDSKTLSVDGRFFQPPFVKLVFVQAEQPQAPKKKQAPAKKAPAKKKQVSKSEK